MRDSTPLFSFGRPFVSPAFDSLTIGGGLTLPIALWLLWGGRSVAELTAISIPLLVLLVNEAHFAASSFRLYTKPGSFQAFPFLTMGLPLLSVVVVSLCVLFSQGLGHHLWALFLTWSPFHYAAQTFGLASMYCHRSGCRLTDRERLLLRWACLMPFFRSTTGSVTSAVGLGWILPVDAILADPTATALFQWAVLVLDALTFAMPVLFFAVVGRRSRLADRRGTTPEPGVPLISMMVVLTNGMWFSFFDYVDGFVWATVFHGLQYLAIVAVFHVRDRAKSPGNRHGPTFHVAVLYAVCVGAGYALFHCWPWAFMLVGFGMIESTMMVVAIINVHHFIVDAYIWRVRRDPDNASVVTANALQRA